MDILPFVLSAPLHLHAHTDRDKYVRLSTYLYVCCLVQLKIDELAQTNEPNVIQNFRKNSIRNGTVAFLGHSPTISAY